MAREHDEILEAISRQSLPAARYAAEAHIAAVSAFVLAGIKSAARDTDGGQDPAAVSESATAA